MTPTEPRFRRDVIVSRQETGDEIAYVVKDPATGRFFRLRETEYFVAQQLDGSTSLEAIRQNAEARFGAPLDPGTLERFVRTLKRSALLETTDVEPIHLAGGRGRVRGSLFYLRLKAFDPDRLFDRLVGRVGFFFTPYFLAISALLIVFAAGVLVVNWSDVAQDLWRLYSLEALLAAWATVILVGMAHEFAHGLACKRFGGEVHELGFMLIYFHPAMYCNVTDAWLFPEKSKRLWVTFAGAYFELFLWAMATVVWRATDPNTWPGFGALVVMATSGIKTFFNLNPLIKLDGYYLLSDVLEMPNLRRKSFAYVGASLRRLLGGAVQDAPTATARERRVYVVYGALASAYSFSLLGFLSFKFGGVLVEHYQAPGLVLFATILTMLVRNRLRKLRRRPPALSSPPAPSSAAPVKRGQAPRPRVRRAVQALAALAGLLLLFLGQMELKVAGEFRMLPSQNADARAEVEGIVHEVAVDEGTRVSEGALIARLSERDFQAELQKIAAEIAEKWARLRMLRAGPRPEEIELGRREVATARTRHAQARLRYEEARQIRAERLVKATATVEKASVQLRYAKIRLERAQPLYRDQMISRKELEDAEELAVVREKELAEARAELKTVVADDLADIRRELAVLEKEVAQAEAKLRVLLAGSRGEEIEAVEAEIARLDAQRHHLEDQQRLLRVVSPIAGVVTTPSRRLRELRGQHVTKGDLIAEIHRLTTMTAEITVPENEIGDVQVGQRVVVKPRAYPHLTFDGVVTAIATTAHGVPTAHPSPPAQSAAVPPPPTRGGRTVLVTTELDNTSLLLKPEMTGKAKILAGNRRIVELVTRRIARIVGVELWSWW